MTGRPEMWAGVECTVNRVGDDLFDQLARTGHDRRPDDLDRLAALGVRTVRYPLLWERADWAWADDRMSRLRGLGLRPVVGLVHHGSGPRHTSLVDPHFADELARYAAAVAARYPWADAYTPVNEPLTTARFSGLYGHWHPHGRDDRTFVRCLLNQCRGVAESMAAVRRVNPAAVLVQTEDFGQTHAGPLLQYQADFENERRWLTWDLLCGRVDRGHPLRRYLEENGATPRELDELVGAPCPPDVVGVNHYVTSERYLDDRLHRYPPHAHGGNGRQVYVDTEAVRVLPAGGAGLAALLRQVARRYGRPVAVTEVHLGCTRDEQLRWLAEVWRTAAAVRAAGFDIHAVTAWSAFGAFDWDSLVTRPAGHYEPGLFDVRCDPPRPTALADLTRHLATGRPFDHPALDADGWWHRPERLSFEAPAGVTPEPNPTARRLLITGGDTALGRAYARVCRLRGLTHVALGGADIDIGDPVSVAAALDAGRPWAVLNAAGFWGPDRAERDATRCHRENTHGPAVLAAACVTRGVRFVTFSSDLVFDGRAGRPYLESDPAGPLSTFGASKAEAERRVAALDPRALIVRTSALISPWDDDNFAARTVRTLQRGEAVLAADDLTISLSFVPDLCHDTLDLLIDGEAGVWHLAAPGPTTWYAFACAVARRCGLDPAGVVGRPAHAFGWAARRPGYSVLGSQRGAAGRPLDCGLDRFAREYEPRPAV